MDWLQWYLAPSLYVPLTPSSTFDGKPPPAHLDVELVEVLYLVIADQQKCSECGHLLGRRLHVRGAGAQLPTRWPLRVDTKCWGWRRHRHMATVTRPSRDLILGTLELAAR